MSGISTHVLDIALGKPASGIQVRLFYGSELIATKTTDADGRCSSFLNSGTDLQPGNYCLRFEVGTYFPRGFFPEVMIWFRIEDPASRYHVPLLISPFGYSTYRGT
jgi:5-hydroxyisourate hydrolase